MTTHLIITGILTARTAVHIGSGNSNSLTDALIRRNGAGEPIIPGTAIAGALRAMLTRLAPNLQIDNRKTLCDVLKLPEPKKQPANEERGKSKPCGCIVCQLFGDIKPTDETDDSIARASRLYVFDAVLNQTFEVLETSKVLPATTVRDGVGINRTTGAAAEAVKFDLEVLPQGTTFVLRLELRNYTGDDLALDKQLLAVALSEWQDGRAWLGGRVAQGLGGFKLENLKIIERDLNDKDQLMTFLRHDNPWDDETGDTNWVDKYLAEARRQVKSSTVDNPAITRRWIQAEFTLQATGPLVANDTTASVISGFDHAPLLLGLDSWRKPVLTGASLRGVIRSHAEKIARTLTTIQVSSLYIDKPEKEQSKLRRQAFVAQCPACDPLASRRPGGEAVALESCDSLLKQLAPDKKKEIEERGDVEDEQLCLACHLFGSTRRGSRLIVEDACFMDENPDYKMLDFLAIDRFTSGGADGAKFDALVLWKPHFRAQLYLENPQEWDLGWLALTLRDMACGWLHVGMGAAKGLGQVEIGDWRLEIGYLEGDELGQALSASSTPDKSGIYQLTHYETERNQQLWLEQAKKWVDSFNQKIGEVAMTTRNGLPDSYFERVDYLYPKG